MSKRHPAPMLERMFSTRAELYDFCTERFGADPADVARNLRDVLAEHAERFARTGTRAGISKTETVGEATNA